MFERRRRGRIGNGGIHASADTPITLPYSRRGRSTGILLCEAVATATKGSDLNDKPKAKRERHHVKIWCSAEDKEAIEAAAKASGLSASAYLRVLGLGHQPRPMIDIEQGRELVRVNGDLGRLGGLLKLWLTDDAKLEEMAPERMPGIIRGVLTKIEANQEELSSIIRKLLRSRQDFSG